MCNERDHLAADLCRSDSILLLSYYIFFSLRSVSLFGVDPSDFMEIVGTGIPGLVAHDEYWNVFTPILVSESLFYKHLS